MTYDQQALALAKWDGWKPTAADEAGRKSWFDATGETLSDDKLMPNYNSLDVLRELEGKLDSKHNLIGNKGFQTQRDFFIETLERIIDPLCAEEDIYWFTIHATSAQRREALLKTLSLWTE